MQSRIKVLFCPSDRSGVGHFRSIWPAQHLKRFHSSEIDVHIDASPNVDDINELAKYDIIHFHRMLGPYEKSAQLFNELKKHGVTLVMDIDDYWLPPPTHHLHPIIVSEKMDKKIEENLRLSDYVTCTTTIFADIIRKFNPNVLVIPNALNLEESMWKSQVVPNESGKVRISWIGGSSHYYDLIKIKDSMSSLCSDSSLKDKFQFIMCGFDTRGSITEIDQDNNKRVRPILKTETVWIDFEKIFTDDYKLAGDEDYKNWLKKIENKDYPNMNQKNYIRRWTLPLTQYGKHYDYCDVCLAPLAETYQHKSDKGQVSYKENMFNKAKSELKIIESGMKRKALIAQNYGIYKELLQDGVTGILVSDDKKGWHKAIKLLVNDEKLRNELADNLHAFVKDRYDINTVNKHRLQVYKDMMAKKKEKQEEALTQKVEQ